MSLPVFAILLHHIFSLLTSFQSCLLFHFIVLHFISLLFYFIIYKIWQVISSPSLIQMEFSFLHFSSTELIFFLKEALCQTSITSIFLLHSVKLPYVFLLCTHHPRRVCRLLRLLKYNVNTSEANGHTNYNTNYNYNLNPRESKHPPKIEDNQLQHILIINYFDLTSV